MFKDGSDKLYGLSKIMNNVDLLYFLYYTLNSMIQITIRLLRKFKHIELRAKESMHLALISGKDKL